MIMKWLKQKINNRRMEKLEKIAEAKRTHSICHSCSKQNDCVYNDGMLIVRCPEFE